MEYSPLHIDSLVDEYATLIKEAGIRANDVSTPDWDVLEEKLPAQGGWSERGATHLVSLVREYGVFVLRNALALAIAAGVEDGELGL